MTISDGYVTLDDLKRYRKVTTTEGDAWFEGVIDAVSASIRQATGHQFNVTSSQTRVFSASHLDIIDVDDISSTSGLTIKTDQDYDGTYETTWTTSDYQLEPLNNLAKNRAVWRIRRKVFGSYWFPRSDQALVQITALWGWPAVPAPVSQACLIQSSRIIERRQTPLGFLQSPEIGTSDRLAAFDPDVRDLLRPYMRNETPL